MAPPKPRSVPAETPLDLRVLLRKLQRAFRAAGKDVPERVSNAVVALRRSAGRPSLNELAPLPRAWFEELGRIRWRGDSPRVHAVVLARIAGQQVAERFIKMLRSLHALNRRVTEAVSLEFVREQAAKGARQLQRDAYDALRWKAVGEAAEGITVHHPGFLAVVDREAADVARLGEDAAFLARHGLASVDPDPLLYTSVRTGRRTGLGSGRSPFVDLAVLFRCVGTDGRTRYLVKIRGQSKVNMVAQLVSDVDLTGKLVLGQLARDELRKGRGAWRFMEVSIEARDLLQDPRSTTLVTFGARDLTSEEIVRHRLLDGIRVEHLVHDVSSADLYRWADELLRLLRVTRAP